MKISLTSDVHLEFGPATIENKEAADVLILAGDVLVASDFQEKAYDREFYLKKIRDYDKFIESCCSEFNNVIMICGNHEHYSGNIDKSVKIIRDRYSNLFNFTLLDNEKTEIDGVVFLGGTCWTNMNKNDPMTKIRVRQSMNDFQLIHKTNGDTLFNPDDAVLRYEKYVSFLFQELDEEKPNVVISHHPPSKEFVHPKYRYDPEMNGAYCNDLDGFIIDHEKEIAAWVCGHVHHAHTEVIGDVPVYCNPRGYFGVEHDSTEIRLLTFEVGK